MPQDASSSSFASRVLWSFLYSSAGNTASKVINVIALLIVLKLISPSAFGIASIVLAIFAVVKSITELGLGVAIVQADDLSRREIDSLFWISLGASAGLYGLITLGAPLVAAFYREAQLTPLIRFYGLIVILYPFYFIPRNLLTRDLSFGKIAVIDNLALLGSSAMMLLLAARGFGAWAIIIGELGNRLGQLVLSQVFRPYLPGFQLHWKEARPRVMFGLYATGSRLLYNLYSNADYLIVGRVFGAEAVGIYTLAYRVVSDTVRTLAANVNQVAYPAFSRLQDDLVRLRRYFFTIARGSLLLIGMVMILVGLYIQDLLMLGGYDEYLAAVPLIRIFAVVGIIRSVSPLVPQLLNAVGQARLNFFYSLSNSILMPLAFLAGAQFGLMGVGWAWMVGYPLVVLLLFIFGARALALPFGAVVSRAFAGLTLLVPLAVLSRAVQVGLAQVPAIGALAGLILGIGLTLSLGLAAIYWRERDTLALLRGHASPPSEVATGN